MIELPLPNELFEQLPRLNQQPLIDAHLRTVADDFQVNEILSFEPEGVGDHLFLYIEKQNCNSDWVISYLQRHFKLKPADVGYAGKKDRYSISRQWFSLYFPEKRSNEVSAIVETIDNDSFKVLTVTRHVKKLRVGAISENQFCITLRGLTEKLDEQIFGSLIANGFPNYYGYQRFGHQGNNLSKALQVLAGKIKVKSRSRRGIYLSALRSYLFNIQVAYRINHQLWSTALDGDCFSLSGSRSYFHCDKVDQPTIERLAQGDVSISGWLVGQQASEVTGAALTLEQSALTDFQPVIALIQSSPLGQRLQSARRPIRAFARDFKVLASNQQQLTLQFGLPSGSYATSLLRELFRIKDLALLENRND
ncbi:tRNA pseudouridine(13) synthase TruD [Aliikangiella maris]|uniref:tRNA pseudouridine synthase D n=2 Tax=Aliikangiella maris TaxID=3162458 RepID=A0ABV3MIH0_9GAMM